MTYQEAIIKLRKKLLLTQMEFAKYIGVSFATINRWEKGKFDPTMKMKRKLKPMFEEHNIKVGDE